MALVIVLTSYKLFCIDDDNMVTKINTTLVYIFILGSLFNGCIKHESQPICLEINIERCVDNLEVVYMCDLGTEILYIPLNSDSVLINSIRKVDFSDTRILVSDNNSCALFDFKGNFISKIGQKGKGHGEYLRITNMKFGHKGNIVVQDGNYFLLYDSCGRFLNRFKPEINPEVKNKGGIMKSWALFNDSLFIGQVANDSGQEKYKAVLFDDCGKTKLSIRNHVFLNLKQFYYSTQNASASIYKRNGYVVFKEVLNDTVFMVNCRYEFAPIYNINLGKFGMTKEARELPVLELGYEKEKCIWVNNIYETMHYLFLDCDFRNNNPAKRDEPVKFEGISGDKIDWWYYPTGMLGVYNKSLKELSFAAPVKSDDKLINDGLRNDLDGGANFYPKAIFNDSTLVMWVDAYQLKELVESKEFRNSTPRYPAKKIELLKLANSLSDKDNPILILYSLKCKY